MHVAGAPATAPLRHGGQAPHPVGVSPARVGAARRARARDGSVAREDSGAPSPPRARQLREPEGAKTSRWQRWRRGQRLAVRRLREAARRLARGFGLWEGSLYEIGGKGHCPPAPSRPFCSRDRCIPGGRSETLRVQVQGSAGQAGQSRPALRFSLQAASSFPPPGLFGTGIQAYFTFLRFLLLLNLLTLLLTASFVLLPLAWLPPPDPGPTPNLSECG